MMMVIRIAMIPLLMAAFGAANNESCIQGGADDTSLLQRQVTTAAESETGSNELHWVGKCEEFFANPAGAGLERNARDTFLNCCLKTHGPPLCQGLASEEFDDLQADSPVSEATVNVMEMLYNTHAAWELELGTRTSTILAQKGSLTEELTKRVHAKAEVNTMDQALLSKGNEPPRRRRLIKWRTAEKEEE